MRFVFFILFLTILSCVPSVQAQSPSSSLVVSPPFQEVVIGENDTFVTVPIRYQNRTSEMLNLQLIAVEFTEVDPYGKVFLPEVDNNQQTAAEAFYIVLSQTEVILEPGAEATVTANVLNSKSLSPGGHYASIIARQKESDVINPGAQSVLPAISSLLLVRKTGGELINLSLLSADWPDNTVELSIPDTINYVFSNQGNVHVIPRGLVKITDLFGRTVFRGIINESSYYVFPQQERYISVSLKQLRFGFPIMLYDVTSEGQETLRQNTFVQRNSFIFISPLFIIFAVFAIVLFVFRKRVLSLVRNRFYAKKD